MMRSYCRFPVESDVDSGSGGVAFFYCRFELNGDQQLVRVEFFISPVPGRPVGCHIREARNGTWEFAELADDEEKWLTEDATKQLAAWLEE